MKKLFAGAFVVTTLLALTLLSAQTVPPAANQTLTGPPTISSDPAFDQLVPAGSKLELIKSK